MAVMDRRQKNVAWHVLDIHGSHTSWSNSVHLAVLMDIRDELQTLNRLLGCTNFLAIPTTLRTIATNTTKRKYTRRTK